MSKLQALEETVALRPTGSAAHFRPRMDHPVQTDDLFRFLDRLEIEHVTVEHPPFFTMEDGDRWQGKIPGMRCKNLFLKDKRNRVWLALVPSDKRVDLARLEKMGGAPKLSFAKPELLHEILGLSPGSVTPFGLLNDVHRRVTLIVDEEVQASEWVNFHPLYNAASTALRFTDLMRFVRALGYEPLVLDCGPRVSAE